MGFARHGQPWRRFLRVGYQFTNEDMFEWLDRFAAWYPQAVYFDAHGMRFCATRRTEPRDVWYCDGELRRYRREGTPRSDKVPEIFHSWRACLDAVPAVDYAWIQNKGFVIRVPWSEDLKRGTDAALCGSRRTPYNVDEVGRDPRYWRALGRYVGIDWCMTFPDFRPAADDWRSHYGKHDQTDLTDIQHCIVPEIVFSQTELLSMYLHADPDMQAFIKSVRKCVHGMLTLHAGVYEARTGKYLGPYANVGKYHYSKRFMKTLALKENAYDRIGSLHSEIKYSKDPVFVEMGKANVPDRLTGIGPTPEMKAEAYLENGRSIDAIDGLDEATRVRLLRRFEKLHSDKKRKVG